MSSQKPTIAFFGATGGCASATLALALKAGYDCTALVRTPSKLRALLETTHNVPAVALDAHLTITQGNVKDVEAVKRALILSNRPVGLIVFGIGGTPKLQLSLLRPFTLDDPHVCRDGMGSLLGALASLRDSGALEQGTKPRIVAISTTGISKTRDVPWLWMPMYSWLLHIPHMDKKDMEALLVSDAAEGNSGVVIVRPTLLTDGVVRGMDNIRAGWEYASSGADDRNVPGPAIGYTISRADVGAWIFQAVVEGGEKWTGKCVSLTY